MQQGVSFIIFGARPSGSAIEQTVGKVKQAIALDTIEMVIDEPFTQQVVVCTNDPVFASCLSGLPVVVDFDDGPFHFGQSLQTVVRRYDIAHAFYIGAGSTPLLAPPEIATICYDLLARSSGLIANSLWSSDFVAFSPASAVESIEPPETDNNLAYLLSQETRLPLLPLRQTIGTAFDIDTPADLMILSLRDDIRNHAKTCLSSLQLDTKRLRSVLPLLVSKEAQILVAGRVSAAVWAHLEALTACRTRVFSEEKGMRASGRQQRGEVRSLLGYHLQSVGAKTFFQNLASLGDVAVLDSRVLFSHLGLRLSAADRFYSDLLQPEMVKNPMAREFTLAAQRCSIPVLLGGHSTVAGGLWALTDTAWRQTDAQHNVAGLSEHDGRA